MNQLIQLILSSSKQMFCLIYDYQFKSDVPGWLVQIYEWFVDGSKFESMLQFCTKMYHEYT